MKKLLLVLTIGALLNAYEGYAINRPIEGFATEGVLQTIEKGGMVLTNQKTHKISMFNTNSKMSQCCNFYVRLTNQSDHPAFFDTRLIRITDQMGRPIQLVTKDEVLVLLERQYYEKRNEMDYWYGREKERLNKEMDETLAERILLDRETTPGRYAVEIQKTVSGHVVPGSRTDEITIRHVEERMRLELKEKIQKNLKKDRELREEMLRLPVIYQQKLEVVRKRNLIDVENAERNYLQSATILPGETYANNFQIKVPQHWVKDLQHIYFVYDLDSEGYTFVYKVEQQYEQRVRRLG
jgi:hypothetical protein